MLLLLACAPGTTCGAGTHAVPGDDGGQVCVADAVADAATGDTSADTGDTAAALDPAAPSDPDRPYADCARDVSGARVSSDDVFYVYHLEYDAFGDWVIQLEDGDADGDFEQGWWNTYSDDRLEHVMDVDDDDRSADIDSRYRYVVRTDGQTSLQEQDWDADGEVDATNTYTYDDGGFLVRRDYAGSSAGAEVWTWTDTQDGLVARGEWDYPLNGVADYVEVETYDGVAVEGSPAGRLLAYEEDEDADGAPERVYTYEYDADGRQSAYEVTGYDAGTFSYALRAETAYDAWGRYARTELRYDDANSAYDYDVTDTYACW